MTYREYYENHPQETFGWCECYTDKNEDYSLVQYDGEIISASANNQQYHRYNGTLTDDVMKSIAMAVNDSYCFYQGWTDEHIALESMHKIGCASCPFFADCQAMDEEIE